MAPAQGPNQNALGRITDDDLTPTAGQTEKLIGLPQESDGDAPVKNAVTGLRADSHDDSAVANDSRRRLSGREASYGVSVRRPEMK